MSRAGFVVDDAGGHEQRSLEGRVVQQMEDAGHDAERVVETESSVINPR